MIWFVSILALVTAIWWGFTIWWLKAFPVMPVSPLVDYRRPYRRPISRRDLEMRSFPITATSATSATAIVYLPEQ